MVLKISDIFSKKVVIVAKIISKWGTIRQIKERGRTM